MADKPEFVDMISEATRQTRRRYAPRVERTCGQGKIAPQSLAAGSVGTVAHGDAEAVEAQILEIQELELSAAAFSQSETEQAPVFLIIAFGKRSLQRRSQVKSAT